MRVRLVSLMISFVVVATVRLFANGGAWQTGVPVTGNGAATDQKKSTNVTIEDEKLAIDLHQEFAAVEVRYGWRTPADRSSRISFSRSMASSRGEAAR